MYFLHPPHLKILYTSTSIIRLAIVGVLSPLEVYASTMLLQNWSKTMKSTSTSIIRLAIVGVLSPLEVYASTMLLQNWSKTMKSRILKSLPFFWYVTWYGISKSHCYGHGGHLRTRFRSTSIGSKTLKGRILKSLPFFWYVTWYGIRKSLLWSWRSSEVTFSVMVRSNDLQLV